MCLPILRSWCAPADASWLRARPRAAGIDWAAGARRTRRCLVGAREAAGKLPRRGSSRALGADFLCVHEERFPVAVRTGDLPSLRFQLHAGRSALRQAAAAAVPLMAKRARPRRQPGHELAMLAPLAHAPDHRTRAQDAQHRRKKPEWKQYVHPRHRPFPRQLAPKPGKAQGLRRGNPLMVKQGARKSGLALGGVGKPYRKPGTTFRRTGRPP